MSLLARYLRAYDNVAQKVKFWAWPKNAYDRYVSPFIANYLFTNSLNPVVLDLEQLPEGSEVITELPVGGLQEVTDQSLETTDYLVAGGYAMRQWVRGIGDIEGVVIVRKRNLPFYNQGTIQVEQSEVITVAELAQLLALYPVTSAPTVAFQILSHQVELPNLLYVDMEQVVSADNPDWFDVWLYVSSSVDLVVVSHTGDNPPGAPYTIVPDGAYGETDYGMDYSRRAGYTRCPVGTYMNIRLYFPGQPTEVLEFAYYVGAEVVERHPIKTPLLDNLRTRLTIRRTITPAGGSPEITTVYFLRDPGQNCAQDDAVFNALTQSQKLAQSTTAEPVPQTNQHWQARDCDGGSGSTTYSLSDDPLIEGGDDGTGTTNESTVAP